jgi:hypothetical protein
MARVQDGDIGFPLGMFSSTEPEQVPRGGYVRSMNTTNRGRVVQCRPGFGWKFNMPSGKLQGSKLFRPSRGGDQLVFAVDGNVYFSVEPFTTFSQIKGLKFSASSDFIYWAVTEKAVDRNPDGSLTLIDPRPMLIMQDGKTAPAFWDGSTGEHVLGFDKLPLGTFMKWTGGRLWVARGQLLFASDPADPLSFFEGLYLGGIGAFILPGEITGMEETPSIDNPVLVVTTQTTTTRFLSNIRDRSLWPAVQNFQQLLNPNIGCVAHRSMLTHAGRLWWYSAAGLTNLDVALASHITSAQPTLDQPMIYSKSRLAEDLTGICCASFENYMMCSVPYCDFLNRHTWVRDDSLDQLTGDPYGWNSYWTGVRPVEWASGVVSGKNRIFFCSVDLDGVNRMWEAFQPERLDNGCPITWTLETRGMFGESVSPKQFRFADVYFRELQGEVDIKVSWASATRGRYQELMIKRVTAMKGSVNSEFKLQFDKDMFSLKKQTRSLRTQDRKGSSPDDFSSCGVESDRDDWIDTGFQLCIMVNGPGAIRAIRVICDEENEKLEGVCQQDELNQRATRTDGAGASADTEEEVLDELQIDDDPQFFGNASEAMTYFDVTVVGTGQATSSISQLAADKMAAATASMRAAEKLKQEAKSFLGGFLAC